MYAETELGGIVIDGDLSIIVIVCARSPLKGRMLTLTRFSSSPNALSPYWRALSFIFETTTDQSSQIHFLGDQPDLLDLRIRRLELKCVFLDCISGFLLSATAVTDLSLVVDPRVDADFAEFGPSPEAFLLTCLQGMPCLRRLNLSISFEHPLLPSTTPSPKDIIPLSKLTGFRYDGGGAFFDTLAAGLSAPSFRDFNIRFLKDILQVPIVHLPRFINEIEEHYHAIHVEFYEWCFCLSLQTQSEYINHCKPRFQLPLVLGYVPESILRMSGALSTRFATIEELRVTFKFAPAFPDAWENIIPWREFLQYFPRLKAFRTEDALGHCIAHALLRDRGELNNELAFLSALEEIEFGKISSLSDKYERGHESAAFEPIVSARQQAGCPIKVFST